MQQTMCSIHFVRYISKKVRARPENLGSARLVANPGWDIIDIIGKHFNQLVREHVAASSFLGITVDETTDISTTTQLIPWKVN